MPEKWKQNTKFQVHKFKCAMWTNVTRRFIIAINKKQLYENKQVCEWWLLEITKFLDWIQNCVVVFELFRHAFGCNLEKKNSNSMRVIDSNGANLILMALFSYFTSNSNQNRISDEINSCYSFLTWQHTDNERESMYFNRKVQSCNIKERRF